MVMPNVNSSKTRIQSSASVSVSLKKREQKLPAPQQEYNCQINKKGQQQQQQHRNATSHQTNAMEQIPEQLVEGCVDSFDHVTFWVGNAKQSAVFYMSQFGFEPFAFRGLETGSRDLACHVLKLNDTIIQFVSAVEPNKREINDFLLSHGDAIKDVAFRVENIDELLRQALENGAELVRPLETLTFNSEAADEGAQSPLGKFVVRRATIKTFGDVTHTFIERNYDYERARFLPGYHKPSMEVSNE